MNLLVEISTKQRVRVLGRCLAALLAQECQDWDLLLINDSSDFPIEDDPTTMEFVSRLRLHRMVWIIEGSQISQAHNHNYPLWRQPWCDDYDTILRLDDDVLLNSYAIERMREFMLDNEEYAAVSGLWFEHEYNDEWHSDRDVPAAETWMSDRELLGQMVGGVVSNWHQRLYHFHAKKHWPVMDVEHIYSSCMYRSEPMRLAGGWPEIYSPGVAHGEETDGTYRLFLSGHKLGVLPDVTGNHLRAPGGIRAMGRDVEDHLRAVDDPKRNNRLFGMPGVYGDPINVGLWGQHARFIGGGARVYFQAMERFQRADNNINVYPIGLYMPIEEANEAFGLSLKEPPEDLPDGEQLDVIIQLGDDLDWFDINQEPLPETAAKAMFVYYPFAGRRPHTNEFTELITLSEFSKEQIGVEWEQKSSVVYPVTRPIGLGGEKEKWIITVGRIDQWKGTLWLAEVFARSGLAKEGYELHLVGGTVGSAQRRYIRQVSDFARTTKGIFIHYDATQSEVEDFYRKAKVLWAAKGMLAEPDNLKEAEHFGLTPIEALSADCIPLVFDLAGHRETTPACWRWQTEEGLIAMTRAVLFLRALPRKIEHLMRGDVIAHYEIDYTEAWVQRIKEIAPKAKTVGIVCQQPYGANGLLHLYYKTASMLAAANAFEVHLPQADPDMLAAVYHRFGISTDTIVCGDSIHDTLKAFDVLITIGSELSEPYESEWTGEKNIAYISNPRWTATDSYDSVIAMSRIAQGKIKALWKLDADIFYPPMPIEAELPFELTLEEKGNHILLVTTAFGDSALDMARLFLRMGIEGWDLDILSMGQPDAKEKHVKAILKMAEDNPNVHTNIAPSFDELMSIYSTAKIVWIGTGRTARPEDSLEYIGTAVSYALATGGTPLAFNGGIHKELIYEEFLWDNLNDLAEKTLLWVSTLHTVPYYNLDIFFDEDYFGLQWERLVYQANARTKEMGSVYSLAIQDRPPVVACVSDSPRIKSGFGIVANEIYKGFVEAGFTLHVLGIMDSKPAFKSDDLPFESFWPCYNVLNPMGDKILPMFITSTEPDIIWMLYDPGNLNRDITVGQFTFSFNDRRRRGQPLPIVAYFPIEGKPVNESSLHMIQKVADTHGVVVTYCQSGADAIKELAPNADVRVVHHGHDHGPFRQYSDDEITMLRNLVGFEDKFIVMSGGVNKRTKQHDILIYAAAHLRELGEDENVLFYMHTDPDDPILQGYMLKWLAHAHGVEDMFLWRPDTIKARGGKYGGIDFDAFTLDQAKKLTRPADEKSRGFLFGNFDLITRYNVADIFVDVSSVEGWGLMAPEAMMCGTPVISVDDGMVRSEILAGGAQLLRPAYWSTWHNGAQLALVDPKEVARRILWFKDSPHGRKALAEKGKEIAMKYTWDTSRKEMVQIIKDVLCRK